MTMERFVGLLLIAAVLLGWVRLWLWRRQATEAHRGRMWRFIALMMLQPACAALLFMMLFPPPVSVPGDALRIATAKTPHSMLLASGPPIIALPEARLAPESHLANVAQAPDLGSALRTHAGTTRIQVLGEGLTPRDRDAARGLKIDFTPPSLPPGISSLSSPKMVAPGASFTVGGQLTGLPKAGVDLIDPAGRVTATMIADRNGRFRLSGTARTAGSATFTLRVRDGSRIVEEAAVPVLVQDMVAPRLLIVAAAPGAEVKYLRRWASDAGFAVTTQMQTGGGVTLGDAPVSMDAGALRRFDVAIFDERSWAALGGGRGAVMAAVRDGMGLLLRASGPLDATTRGQWQALGFTLSGGDEMAPVALPPISSAEIARTRVGIGSQEAPVDIATPDDSAPEISRLTLVPGGTNTVSIIKDAGGTTMAAWRAMGKGRIGLFTATDSYGLTLTGRRDLYETWWSDMMSVLARPAMAMRLIDVNGWAGERVSLCAIGRDASVTAPDGRRSILAIMDQCGAYWPRMAGWHWLNEQGRKSAFYIRPADMLNVMQAARNANATLMSTGESKVRDGETGTSVPMSPWPFAIAWLLASALLWWLERSRLGRTAD